MKLIIDIPTEFETDYKDNQFKDFFSRVLCDIEKGTLCGNYEKETAEMFLKAFNESVYMVNVEVLRVLEEKTIPKKVIRLSDTEYYDYKCPVCGTPDKDCMGRNYCNLCGQVLDK